ncbi:Calpain-13, partial [Lonchura striata]
MQGEIGDCWMLAALGSLTLRKHFLENVLPKDQGFQDDYAGIFHFRAEDSQWKAFPQGNITQKPQSSPGAQGRGPNPAASCHHQCRKGEAEVLQGSYQNLNGGYLSDALVDLTGGVQVQFSLKDPPPDLEEILKAADKSRCLMGCSTSGQSRRNIELRNGIVQGHAYTITGAVKIPYKNGWKHIIRIWNPWGHGEWKGPWSDKSPQWDHVEPKYREALLRNKDDGEFWMSCKNFQEQFSWLYICNNTPTFLDFGDEPYTTWSLNSYTNLWRPGLPTRRNRYSSGAASTNPQYFFKVLDHNPKTCNVAISLMQKHAEHVQDEKNLKIGFFITTENSRVLKQIFLRIRDVTSYFILSPGTYAVVPAATEDQEFEFLLRIFIKNQDYHENSNSPTSPVLSMDVPRQNQDISYKALFLRYAKQGSTIDASQLQQLLNEVILQGLASDAQLLRLMMLRYGDASGRVGFSDFVCCMLRLDTM